MNRASPCLGVVALASALVLCGSPAVSAAPIFATVDACPGDVCTVTPDGGPVAVDPLGFTLDVRWEPEFIRLLTDPGGHEFMQLLFSYTGVHDGTENMGDIDLLDAAGNPIGSLNVSFDDVHDFGGTFRANYEIFGPTPAFLHGFTLSLSDGSGVDTLQFVSARIFPAELVSVPEPSLLVLLGTAVALAVRRRGSAHAARER